MDPQERQHIMTPLDFEWAIVRPEEAAAVDWICRKLEERRHQIIASRPAMASRRRVRRRPILRSEPTPR